MKVFLISNMYPSNRDPLFGVFVKNFKSGLEMYGVKFQFISVIKGKSVNIYQKIKKYVIYSMSILSNYYKSDYDLMYIHYLSINSLILFIFSFNNYKRPIVVNVHGSDVMEESFFMSFFNKHLLLKSSLIIAPSNYFKQEMLLKYKFLDDKKIYVSPSGGVDPSIFHIKEIVRDKKTLTLGYVSRIDKGKGWDIFLELVKKINKKGILVNGIVVGDGSQKEDLLQKINDLGINNFIEYKGLVKQNKLIDLFNQIDLFIFPTIRSAESLGLVGLEAMACGTPVLGSDIAGPGEYIIDGFNGFKFEPGNVSALFEKVEKYLSLNSNVKLKMSENAYCTSINYQKEKVMSDLRNELLKLC
tara:strand:+ start:241 stop:1311 length:1071 start_codon:yes stop_codon:yes gene_type:complete